MPQRPFLTADQHRRLAAILRRATVPGHEEQALRHEQLAEAIDRQQRQAAELLAAPVCTENRSAISVMKSSEDRP